MYGIFTADLPQKSTIRVGKYTIPRDPMGLEWSFLEDSDDAEEAEDVTLHEPPEPMEPVRHTELAELPGCYHYLENISCRLPIKNKVYLDGTQIMPTMLGKRFEHNCGSCNWVIFPQMILCQLEVSVTIHPDDRAGHLHRLLSMWFRGVNSNELIGIPTVTPSRGH